MVANLWSVLGDLASGFVTFLVNIFESIVAVFYTAGGEGVTAGFTFIGQLTLLGFVIGCVYMALNYVKRLLGQNQ